MSVTLRNGYKVNRHRTLMYLYCFPFRLLHQVHSLSGFYKRTPFCPSVATAEKAHRPSSTHPRIRCIVPILSSGMKIAKDEWIVRCEDVYRHHPPGGHRLQKVSLARLSMLSIYPEIAAFQSRCKYTRTLNIRACRGRKHPCLLYSHIFTAIHRILNALLCCIRWRRLLIGNKTETRSGRWCLAC